MTDAELNAKYLQTDEPKIVVWDRSDRKGPPIAFAAADGEMDWWAIVKGNGWDDATPGSVWVPPYMSLLYTSDARKHTIVIPPGFQNNLAKRIGWRPRYVQAIESKTWAQHQQTCCSGGDGLSAEQCGTYWKRGVDDDGECRPLGYVAPITEETKNVAADGADGVNSAETIAVDVAEGARDLTVFEKRLAELEQQAKLEQEIAATYQNTAWPTPRLENANTKMFVAFLFLLVVAAVGYRMMSTAQQPASFPSNFDTAGGAKNGLPI